MGRLDDVPIKKDESQAAPEWVAENVVVVHETFGRGVVRRVGLYKRFHTIWVEFDNVGVKALAPKYAIPQMRRAESAPEPDAPAPQAASRLRSWVRRGR